jgi:hypothetical protein
MARPIEVYCPCGVYLGRYFDATWDDPGEYSFDLEFLSDEGVVYCSQDCLDEAHPKEEETE